MLTKKCSNMDEAKLLQIKGTLSDQSSGLCNFVLEASGEPWVAPGGDQFK